MDQGESFDAVADLYAEVRRGYPAALFDDLAALAGLGSEARVLEVGCGAGQATSDLAARATCVVALDPGPALIEQARRRVAASDVRFVVSRFEEFDPPAGKFDLVVSAQAWHWVDPAVGFAKAATALRPGGRIAIFGHVPMPPRDPIATAFKEAFDAHAPGVWGAPPPEAGYLPSGPFAQMIVQSGRFGPVTHRRYAWSWRLDPATFGRYLRTNSSYHFLSEAPRFALFDALAQAVRVHGGVYDSEWETHLYLARRL